MFPKINAAQQELIPPCFLSPALFDMDGVDFDDSRPFYTSDDDNDDTDGKTLFEFSDLIGLKLLL